MKTCRDCFKAKPFSEFYSHEKMKDGKLNKCIDCVKARVRRHRKANLEIIRAYDRQRGRTKDRLERARIYSRKRNKSGVGTISSRNWRNKNPEKYNAHIKLNNAVRDGKVRKGKCRKCRSKRSEGHHLDYSKPLEVFWLCRKHHAELHRKYKD